MKNKQKNIFIIFLMFMLTSIMAYASNKDVFQGSWYSEGVVYSFVNDSLYIDELGNEGDVYTYKYENGIVHSENIFGDELSFKIDKISPNKIKITFEEEKPFIMKRVFNYDLDNMRFKDNVE